jgi:hypothetical protein
LTSIDTIHTKLIPLHMRTVTVCTITTTGGPCGVCLVLQNTSNRALGFESTAINATTATDAGTSVSSTNYINGLGSAGLPDSVSVCIDFTNTAVSAGSSSGSSSSRRAFYSSSTTGVNNATAAAAAAAAQQQQQQSDIVTLYIRTKAAAASTSTVLASAQLPRTAVPPGGVTFVRLDSFPPELAPSAPLSSAPLNNPFAPTAAAAAPSATLWTFKVYINDADRSSAPALTAAVPLREVRAYTVCMRIHTCDACHVFCVSARCVLLVSVQ